MYHVYYNNNNNQKTLRTLLALQYYNMDNFYIVYYYKIFLIISCSPSKPFIPLSLLHIYSIILHYNIFLLYISRDPIQFFKNLIKIVYDYGYFRLIKNKNTKFNFIPQNFYFYVIIFGIKWIMVDTCYPTNMPIKSWRRMNLVMVMEFPVSKRTI